MSLPKMQQGATTLFITLVILLILGLIVFGSAAVGMFEQRTATNDNRARLAEQAAEYALNLGGEYIKANVSRISTTRAGGWLDATTAANVRWKSCAGITDATHPCFAERNTARRARMYYFTSDGSAAASGSSPKLNLPLSSTTMFPTGAKLVTVGGTAAFNATTTVRALLCRVEEPASGAPDCALSPTKGRRVAVTLIANATLPGESAAAQVKETWGTLATRNYSAATPLVTSGVTSVNGNWTVVSAPNAGGFGVAVSVWSPNDVTGTSAAWKTCTRDDYLNGADLSLIQSCGDTINCKCDSEIVSSKSSEGTDILDVDGNVGAMPDITFFPGSDKLGNRLDNPADFTDDNLFEWIFGVDVTGGNGTTVLENCGQAAATNCEVQALEDLGFDMSHANCDFLDATSSGLFYVAGAGNCEPLGDVGSADNCVVLVVDESYKFGHRGNFHGTIFVRSEDNTAEVTGNANGTVFGSVVVEGGGSFNGTMDLVYDECDAGNPNSPLAETTRFGRLPGSWLDSATGI
ncbi:MAG: hypothetical protein ABIR05_07025 [Luteimonas sp.]